MPGSRTVSYGYDDASRRTSITYPGGSNQASYAYDNANRLSSVTDWNSQATSYAYDDANRMTTTTLPSGTGVVVNGYTYDIYGKKTSSSGTQANEFDFAGQQTDPTGLQYLRARYMDPETGTFMSRDPLSGSPGWPGHPLGYVGGNPTGFSDPTGLCGGFLQLPPWVCGDVPAYGNTTVADVYDAVAAGIESGRDVIDPWLKSYIDANITLPLAPGAVLSFGCQVEILDPFDPHCYTAVGIGVPGVSITVAPGQTITDGHFCELSGGNWGASGQVGAGGVLNEKGNPVPFGTIGIGTPGATYTCGTVDPGFPDLWPF